MALHALALTLPACVDPKNPFRFVGMVVIFGSAMAWVAIAFIRLGPADSDKAFALPTAPNGTQGTQAPEGA